MKKLRRITLLAFLAAIVSIATATLSAMASQSAVADNSPQAWSSTPDGILATAVPMQPGAGIRSPAVKLDALPSGTTCGKLAEDKKACITAIHVGEGASDLRKRHESAIKPADVIPLPDWCYDYSDAWYFFRTEACAISANSYTIYDLTTGLPVGGFNFVFWWFSFTSTSLSNWQSQVEFEPISEPWGLAAGSSFQGNAACFSACTILYSNFPAQAARPGAIAKGDAQFRTTAINPSAVGFTDTFFDYWVNSPCCGPSTPGTSEPPRTRCDNATPGRGVGCVFPDYRPTIVYTDSTQYCCPEVARHLRQAQNSGLPSVLTRLTDQTLRDRNRIVACKDSYVRPPGKSCDEYPFASSWQGALTGGGDPRTFSWCDIPQVPPGSGLAGYSVCMVNATQNNDAGTVLGSFYGQNRVIDNEPFQVVAN